MGKGKGIAENILPESIGKIKKPAAFVTGIAFASQYTGEARAPFAVT